MKEMQCNVGFILQILSTISYRAILAKLSNKLTLKVGKSLEYFLNFRNSSSDNERSLERKKSERHSVCSMEPELYNQLRGLQKSARELRQAGLVLPFPDCLQTTSVVLPR